MGCTLPPRSLAVRAPSPQSAAAPSRRAALRRQWVAARLPAAQLCARMQCNRRCAAASQPDYARASPAADCNAPAPAAFAASLVLLPVGYTAAGMHRCRTPNCLQSRDSPVSSLRQLCMRRRGWSKSQSAPVGSTQPLSRCRECSDGLGRASAQRQLPGAAASQASSSAAPRAGRLRCMGQLW